MSISRSSYEKINYSLRPAKAIERKMLCEVMHRLSLIHSISKYRYIGFGSTYFSDFNLFHKLLGIKDLISIEKDIKNEDRFVFNNPFSCIDLKFGLSSEILPNLTWNKYSVVWLDYDYKIDKSMFHDIETFFFKAKAGSLFLITVDVKPDYPEREIDNEKIPMQTTSLELKKFRIEKLAERVGFSNIPMAYRNINLNIINNPSGVYHIINDKIQEVVSRRNGGLNPRNQIMYRQLFNFIYNDGTLMLTVGGIIYNDAQKSIVDKMRFDEFDFVKNGEEAFSINVPKLTFKEIRLLDSLLPGKLNLLTGKAKRKGGKIFNDPLPPKEDVLEYSKVYRYFPTFAETSF